MDREHAVRAALWTEVLAQKRGEFAERFDAVHSVERAVRVGSISQIIAPTSLRSFLIEAVQRGMRRAVDPSPDRATRTNGDESVGLAQSASS